MKHVIFNQGYKGLFFKKLPREVPITLNFNYDKIIGIATNFVIKDNKLKANLNFHDTVKSNSTYKQLKPCVGFILNDVDNNLKLISIGMSIENEDRTIPALNGD